MSQVANLCFTDQEFEIIVPNGVIMDFVRELRKRDLAYSGACEFKFSLQVE